NTTTSGNSIAHAGQGNTFETRRARSGLVLPPFFLRFLLSSVLQMCWLALHEFPSPVPHFIIGGSVKNNLERRVAYSDLREWIDALERAGELKRIKTEVDPVLEITEITDRVSKGAAAKYGRPGGPALLFENVRGASGIPVLINQFGSERRMQM